MKKLASEFIGTFCLIFAGTGAIIINDASGGAVSHVGIALTFGLIVLAMILHTGRHFRRAFQSRRHARFLGGAAPR